MILMFRSKNSAEEIIEKARKVSKNAKELVECLEDTVKEMESEYVYRHDEYPYEESYRRGLGRYGYGSIMR